MNIEEHARTSENKQIRSDFISKEDFENLCILHDRNDGTIKLIIENEEEPYKQREIATISGNSIEGKLYRATIMAASFGQLKRLNTVRMALEELILQTRRDKRMHIDDFKSIKYIKKLVDDIIL